MSTPRKAKLVPCGAPLPNGGRCSRPAEPGYSCGFHRPSPVPPGAPLPDGAFCTCEKPFVVGDTPLTDDGAGPRCLICSKRPRSEAPAENGRPESAPRGLGDPSACDPSLGSVPDQLRLKIEGRADGGHG